MLATEPFVFSFNAKTTISIMLIVERKMPFIQKIIQITTHKNNFQEIYFGSYWKLFRQFRNASILGTHFWHFVLCLKKCSSLLTLLATLLN